MCCIDTIRDMKCHIAGQIPYSLIYNSVNSSVFMACSVYSIYMCVICTIFILSIEFEFEFEEKYKLYKSIHFRQISKLFQIEIFNDNENNTNKNESTEGHKTEVNSFDILNIFMCTFICDKSDDLTKYTLFKNIKRKISFLVSSF